MEISLIRDVPYSLDESDLYNNQKETHKSTRTGTPLPAPKFCELSTLVHKRVRTVGDFLPTPSKFCAQYKQQAHICDTFRFNYIRQIATTVDADAKNLVTVVEAARWAGSHWMHAMHLVNFNLLKLLRTENEFTPFAKIYVMFGRDRLKYYSKMSLCIQFSVQDFRYLHLT